MASPPSSSSLPTRRPPTGLSVLIAGAGIGGLVAALELWRHGFSVRIIEKTASPSSLGDGFTIGPSATAVWRTHWPSLSAASDAATQDIWISFHAQTGAKLKGPVPMTATLPESFVRDGGVDWRSMPRHSRPELQEILLAQLREIGVEVEYGVEVAEYTEIAEEGKGAVLTTAGERLQADLVVAADGVRGKSWKLINGGKEVGSKSSGDAMFRVAFPRECVEKDPVVMERFGKTAEGGQPVLEMWSGPGMYAGFWLYGTTAGFALTHPDPVGTSKESWSHRLPDSSAVLAYTATIPGWPAAADRFIAAAPPNSIVDWKLLWRDPQPRWTSPAGRVVALGDAAHTFLPSSGNGATQAIEDAAGLAAVLDLAVARHGKESIPTAVKVHTLLRFQRVAFLQALGFRNRNARDTRKTKEAKQGEEVKMASPFHDWTFRHDAEAYAEERFEEAWRCVVEGREGEFRHTSGVPKRKEYADWSVEGLLRGEEEILEGDWS